MTDYTTTINNITNGKGVIRVPSNTLPMGKYSMELNYSGGGKYNASTTTNTVQIKNNVPYAWEVGVDMDVPFTNDMFTNVSDYNGYAYGGVDENGYAYGGNYCAYMLTDYPLIGDWLVDWTLKASTNCRRYQCSIRTVAGFEVLTLQKDMGQGWVQINRDNSSNTQLWYCEPLSGSEYRTLYIDCISNVLTVGLADGSTYSHSINSDLGPLYLSLRCWGGTSNRPLMKNAQITSNIQ